MRELIVSYATWSSLAALGQAITLHVWRGKDATEASHAATALFLGNRDLLLRADVLAGSADEVNWIATFQPTSTEAPDMDDALALLLGGVVVANMPMQSTLAGMASVTVMDVPNDSMDYFQSWEAVSQAGTTDFLDIWVGDTLVGPEGVCYLVGGEYVVRTDAARGSALHLALLDRDDVSGVFDAAGLERTKIAVVGITGDTSTAVQIRGVTSQAVSNILEDLTAGVYAITFYTGYADGQPIDWAANEAVEFLDAVGVVVANGSSSTWTEGDVLNIQTNVREEWIEGFEERDMRPGGTKPLPLGFYIRIKTYNAHATEELRVTIRFQVGVK